MESFLTSQFFYGFIYGYLSLFKLVKNLTTRSRRIYLYKFKSLSDPAESVFYCGVTDSEKFLHFFDGPKASYKSGHKDLIFQSKLSKWRKFEIAFNRNSTSFHSYPFNLNRFSPCYFR